jgi:hypothetical protein
MRTPLRAVNLGPHWRTRAKTEPRLIDALSASRPFTSATAVLAVVHVQAAAAQ